MTPDEKHIKRINKYIIKINSLIRFIDLAVKPRCL